MSCDQDALHRADRNRDGLACAPVAQAPQSQALDAHVLCAQKYHPAQKGEPKGDTRITGKLASVDGIHRRESASEVVQRFSVAAQDAELY